MENDTKQKLKSKQDQHYILVVDPILAQSVGLTDAIFLQQLHYWLQRSKNIQEGFTWVYKSYPKWKEELPFFSISTLKRIVSRLEDQEILLCGCFNRMKADQTKWYRINYQKLAEICPKAVVLISWCQSDPAVGQYDTMDGVKVTQPIPYTTTETKTDIFSAGAEKEKNKPLPDKAQSVGVEKVVLEGASLQPGKKYAPLDLPLPELSELDPLVGATKEELEEAFKSQRLYLQEKGTRLNKQQWAAQLGRWILQSRPKASKRDQAIKQIKSIGDGWFLEDLTIYGYLEKYISSDPDYRKKLEDHYLKNGTIGNMN